VNKTRALPQLGGEMEWGSGPRRGVRRARLRPSNY
jgi:hypothetical protein